MFKDIRIALNRAITFIILTSTLFFPSKVFANTVVIPVTFRSVDSCTQNNVASSKFGVDNDCTFIVIALPDFSAIPVNSKILYVSMTYLNGTNLTPPFPTSNWPLAALRSTNTRLSASTTYDEANSEAYTQFATDSIFNGSFTLLITEFQKLFDSSNGFIIKKMTSTNNEFLSSFASFTLTVDYTESTPSAPIFSDRFLGGFDPNFWHVYTNADTAIPLSSPFGIGDTGGNLDLWYRLRSTVTPIPDDTIVKLDTKINVVPSEVSISCKDIAFNDAAATYTKRLLLKPDGTFSFDTFINGGGSSSGLIFTYDKSEGIHHFELDCFGTQTTFIEDNVLKGTWDDGNSFTPNSVSVHFKNGDSEFANYQLCNSNGCDEIPLTPSPTPTATPTQTPTTSPSPTPTPPPPAKVVVIPGVLGSWNPIIGDCVLTGNDNGWGTYYLEEPVYNPIVLQLQAIGKSPVIYYYDWRKTTSDNIQRFSQFLDNQTAPNETVDVIGHSYGGLVARAYLEYVKSHSLPNKIHALVTVGSPHGGAVKAYPIWSRGEVWKDDDFVTKTAMALAVDYCAVKKLKNQKVIVRTLYPSIGNILPRFPYIQMLGGSPPVDPTLMDAVNTWTPDVSFSNPYYGTSISTVTGTSQPTLNDILTKPRNKTEEFYGWWTDGKPFKYNLTTFGDTSVRVQDGVLNNTPNTTIPASHTDIISSLTGITPIFSQLGYPPPILAAQNIPLSTSTLMFIPNNASIVVIDPKNTSKSEKNGMVGFINPEPGTYKATMLQLNQKPATVLILQVLPNGTSQWREIPVSEKSKQSEVIQYDGVNPI